MAFVAAPGMLIGRPVKTPKRALLGCLVLLTPGVLAWSSRCQAAEPCDPVVLRVEADRAWAWRRNWTLINVGVMAGSLGVVPFVDRESRPDWIVSGASSGITALATFIWPLRVESAAAELEALPPAERARQLPRLWRESAEDEHDRVTWPWHLANFGLSAAAGAVIAFGYRHYASGALTAAAGTALGELQIVTQPTRLSLDCRAAWGVLPSVSYVPAGAGTSPRLFVGVNGWL
jgi:hypothetical protein